MSSQPGPPRSTKTQRHAPYPQRYRDCALTRDVGTNQSLIEIGTSLLACFRYVIKSQQALQLLLAGVHRLRDVEPAEDLLKLGTDAIAKIGITWSEIRPEGDAAPEG